MLERLLGRFSGAFSYENGITTMIMARVSTNGNEGSPYSFKKMEISDVPVPILATLKNKKEVFPYENEKEFQFSIEYINQNDETHIGYCVIPIYADLDLDFRVIMQDDNDFVKEITNITPRSGFESKCGDPNDTVEIMGVVGNIAKTEAVISLELSEVFYNIRVASMQRYVDAAHSGGLRLLSKGYGINISSTLDQKILRTLTRLFSTFVIPSQSIMQSSMNLILSIIDPLAYVEVYADYDNPYKMIIDFYSPDLEFKPIDVELLLLFVERYCPVPSITEINIIFEEGMDDSAVATDSGIVEIEASTVLMGSSTIMSPSLIMGSGTTTILTLPNDYP